MSNPIESLLTGSGIEFHSVTIEVNYDSPPRFVHFDVVVSNDRLFAQRTARLWAMSDRQFEEFVRYGNQPGLMAGLTHSLRRSYPTRVEEELIRSSHFPPIPRPS